ncbi:hypothetical protein [uncultured Tateyamaria sp.]|uniref:hypothetical protein n=1 Tax=uncultured Tateyamaria sp. TaxID=455651 RepID=UPI00262E9D58|nr:hypothetical protein [uncultured Tateyamaria sp.]
MMAVLDTLGYIAANVMILCLLFWFLFWDCERQNAIRRYIIPKVYQPFGYIGLNAEWVMFTPDPPLFDMWPMAELSLKDGRIVYWEPRPFQEMSIPEKIWWKKHLKFYLQVCQSKADNQIKRDLVDYLLRVHPDGDSCVEIHLFRVRQKTPDFYRQDQPRDPPTKQEIFFLRPRPPEERQ